MKFQNGDIITGVNGNGHAFTNNTVLMVVENSSDESTKMFVRFIAKENADTGVDVFITANNTGREFRLVSPKEWLETHHNAFGTCEYMGIDLRDFEGTNIQFSTFWDGYGKSDYSYYSSHYDIISDYDDFSYVVTAFHNGKEIYCDYVGDELQCLAQFMMDNPDVPYSEVVSVIPYDEYVDYYDGGQFGAYSQK